MELDNRFVSQINFRNERFLQVNSNLIKYVLSFNKYRDLKLINHLRNKRLFKIFLQFDFHNNFYSDPNNLTLFQDFPTKALQASKCFQSVFLKCENALCLVFPSLKNHILVQEIGKERENYQLEGHQREILCINHHFLNGIDYLLSVDRFNHVILWNLNERTQITVLNFNFAQGNIYSCLLTTIDKELCSIYSFSSNEPIIFHKILGKDDQEPIKLETGQISYFINIWKNEYTGEQILINGTNTNVMLIDLNDFEKRAIFDEKTGGSPHFSAFVIERDVFELVEVEDAGVIRIWNVETLEMLQKVITGVQALRSVISWDLNTIIVSGYGKLVVYNCKHQFMEHIVEPHQSYRTTVLKIAHPKHGETIITGGTKYVRIRYQFD